MLKNYSADIKNDEKQDLWNRTFQRLSADPEEPFEDLIIELAAEIDYLSGEIYELTKQINEKDAEAKRKDDFYEMMFDRMKRMKRKIIENRNTSKETTESTELTAELNVAAAADPSIKSSVGELYVAGDLYINISKFEPEKGDPDD